MIRQEVPVALTEVLGVNSSSSSELAGNANDNHLIGSGSKMFVVKRLQEHTPDNEELEGVYRDYLADMSLPVSRFVKFSPKSYVFNDGPDSYVATEYVKGDEAREKTNEVIKETAAFLATMHLLDPAKMPYRHNWLKPTYINEVCETTDKLDPTQKKEFIRVLKQYPDFWDGSLPKGIVHGDLHAGNLIVDSSNKIASVIDWEEVSIEPVLLDLAGSIRFFGTVEGSIDPSMFSSFLNAYETIRPLIREEKENLEAAINYTVLVESVWAHSKYAEGFLSESKFTNSKDAYQHWLHIPKFIRA